MGCGNSFLFKREDYEHIDWYTERVDRRLGNIIEIKSSKLKENFIAKKIGTENLNDIK